jgi:hypothetical protein
LEQKEEMKEETRGMRIIGREMTMKTTTTKIMKNNFNLKSKKPSKKSRLN